MSAAGLVWELAGRPDCGKPTVEHAGSCYVCGETCHGNVAVKAKVALGVNFDHTQAGDRAANHVCAACMWALSGKPPLTLRMWSGIASPDRIFPPTYAHRAKAFVKSVAPAVSALTAVDALTTGPAVDTPEISNCLGFSTELAETVNAVAAAISKAQDDEGKRPDVTPVWPDVVPLLDEIELHVERTTVARDTSDGIDATLCNLLDRAIASLQQTIAVVRMFSSSPHIHLTNRADMTPIAALLTNPPAGPWAAWIAVSGQKHVLPYTDVNNGTGPWAVRVEDATATSTPDQFATVLARVCHLRNAGFPETNILAGDPGTWITTMDRLTAWQTHGQPLTLIADSPLLQLACMIPTKGTISELTARYGHHAPNPTPANPVPEPTPPRCCDVHQHDDELRLF